MNFDRTVVPARFTAAVRENESLARYIVVDARTAPSPNTSDATARRLSLYALAPCHVVHIHSLSFVARVDDDASRRARMAHDDDVDDATRCGVIHGRASTSFMGRGGKPKGGRGGRGRGRGKGGLTEEERLEKEREVRRDRARAREAAVTVTMRARVDIEPDGENDD